TGGFRTPMQGLQASWFLSISTSVAYLLAHDPQAQVRRVPALLPQEGPAHGEAEESRHLQDARGGETSRAGGTVLQASLKPRWAPRGVLLQGGHVIAFALCAALAAAPPPVVIKAARLFDARSDKITSP